MEIRRPTTSNDANLHDAIEAMHTGAADLRNRRALDRDHRHARDFSLKVQDGDSEYRARSRRQRGKYTELGIQRATQ